MVSSQNHVPNRRGRQSRDLLLDAAALLMAERGYAGTSMSVLSAAAGIPKSAIYHHFGSKAGLLAEVMGLGARSFFDDLRERHRNPPPGGTPAERLTWYMSKTAEVFASHQDFLRLYLVLILTNEAAVVPEAARLVVAVRTEGRAYMNHMIKSAFISEGEAIAGAVADDLDAHGIASFDGAFVESQAGSDVSMPQQMPLLAEAIAALGHARAQARRSGVLA